jgi:pseudaminic acid cytidylyltransferase
VVEKFSVVDCEKMNIAVIPARGGSKRILRKNIKLFGLRPMISYSIEIAKKSGLFEHIFVSTDDKEIAAIAKEFGAEVPFIRPVELSDDLTPTVPVMVHAIKALELLGITAEKYCCIYPCAPFIQLSDLMGTLDLLETTSDGYSYPIAEFPSKIQRALRLLKNGKLQPIDPQHELTRTQDLEPAFFDAGQFYWGWKSTWLKGAGLQTKGSGYLVPNWRVVDIDTQEDWETAEKMYQFFSFSDQNKIDGEETA